MTGQASARALISNVTNALKCEVTTDSDHGYSTNKLIRITDLAEVAPSPRGMQQINNKTFNIEVTSTRKFLLRDPITLEYIDSRNYTPYVEGGRTNLEPSVFQYEGE